MAEQNWTPAAVALAGLFIGAGLFFGLRDRRSPDPAASGATSSSIGAPAASIQASSAKAVQPALREPSAAEPSLKPSAPQVSRDEITRQAKDAIDAHRGMLADKCWKPFVRGPGDPKPARFVLNISFDAGGNQIVRGIAEERGTGHPDVTACVTQRLPPIQIPPPGANAYIEIPLTLP